MAAGEFLETQAALHPELEAEYFEFRKLFNRKCVGVAELEAETPSTRT